MLTMPTKMSDLLVRTTQTPDLEAALWKVLTEYIDLKLHSLRERLSQFEQKWGMPFNEFAERFHDDNLGVDSYSWEVEQDFWKWEQTVTLVEHYQELKG